MRNASVRGTRSVISIIRLSFMAIPNSMDRRRTDIASRQTSTHKRRFLAGRSLCRDSLRVYLSTECRHVFDA